LKNWKETNGILEELLEWMKNNNIITNENYIILKNKAFKILRSLENVGSPKAIKEYSKFSFNKFFELDEAQKAFVIFASVDEKFENKRFHIDKEGSFKLLVNTIYLKLVKNFSRIKDQIKRNNINNDISYIRKYIELNPKIKRLGCGKFSLNFHKHVYNLLCFINENNIYP